MPGPLVPIRFSNLLLFLSWMILRAKPPSKKKCDLLVIPGAVPLLKIHNIEFAACTTHISTHPPCNGLVTALYTQSRNLRTLYEPT